MLFKISVSLQTELSCAWLSAVLSFGLKELREIYLKLWYSRKQSSLYLINLWFVIYSGFVVISLAHNILIDVCTYFPSGHRFLFKLVILSWYLELFVFFLFRKTKEGISIPFAANQLLTAFISLPTLEIFLIIKNSIWWVYANNFTKTKFLKWNNCCFLSVMLVSYLKAILCAYINNVYRQVLNICADVFLCCCWVPYLLILLLIWD